MRKEKHNGLKAAATETVWIESIDLFLIYWSLWFCLNKPRI